MRFPSSTPCRILVLAAAIHFVTVSVAPAATVEPEADVDTLAVVNGEPITSADIDAMIMRSHQTLDMSQETNSLLAKLLEKAINDRLILQDAEAMGLHEDPEVVGPITEKSIEREIALYTSENFQFPTDVSDAEIHAFFEEYYHRILLRQVSVRTKEEAEAVLERLRAGEDMDAMARESSLDTRRIHGGLHNFKHWADVEIPLREASRGLPIGALSEPFPYREAWAVVRVEDRKAPDFVELPEFRNYIRAQLLAVARQEAWDGFVDSLRALSPVQRVESSLAAIREDAALLFDGKFKEGGEAPALRIDDAHFLTERQLREATSRNAMEMGDQPFEEIFEFSLDQQTERLLLQFHSERAGYAERPEIVAAYDRDLTDLMLKTYLNETVVSKIAFNNAELDAFYEEHKDEFRGAEEVRLGFVFFDTLEHAQTVAKRLHDGADWNYVKREVEGGGHASEKTKFAPLKMFSDPVIAEVEKMEVGATSDPIVFNGRWMVVRLEGRRPGDPLPRSDVEMTVRNAVFQRKFQGYLDEQLELLKERSEIVRHKERIERYLRSES